MSDWIDVDGEGLVAAERIVAVGLAESAPIRRMIHALSVARVVNLTGGRKRQTAVVLDSGHVIITPLTVAELAAQLEKAQEA